MLYGGAAGGGKSDALLMDQLRYVDRPNYSGIVFRRTFADLALPGAIMDRSHQWLGGTDAHWDGLRKQWRFPSGGRLAFGYLDTERHKYRYQGAEFHRIGFDELTQFTETQYRYLLSRLRRRADSDIPIAARSASNPGGEGHDWVKARFIDGDKRFVPARLEDNPSLDAVNYREQLSMLDAVTRKQLEEGVWVQDTSGLMYRPISASWVDSVPAIDYLVLALDFGVVDENALAVLGWQKNSRVVWVLEAYRFSGSPSAMGEEVAKLVAAYKNRFTAIVGDIGGLGKGYQVEIEQRFAIPIDAAEKQNKLGYIRLLNGALERGELVACRGKCEDLRTEWSSLQRLPDGREAPSQPNHAADAVLYGWRACVAFAERDKPPIKSRDEIVQAEAEKAMRTLRDEDDEDL